MGGEIIILQSLEEVQHVRYFTKYKILQIRVDSSDNYMLNSIIHNRQRLGLFCLIA